jgi:hypothetical protein
MNRLQQLAAICALAATTGCAGVPASTATFENTTVPVSIGPVQKLGGAPVEERADVHASRSVEALNLYRYNANGHGGGTITHQTEGSGKFDVEAERALEGCPNCRVHLDEIHVGSHSAVLIGLSDDTHWTGTDLLLFRAGKGR